MVMSSVFILATRTERDGGFVGNVMQLEEPPQGSVVFVWVMFSLQPPPEIAAE